MARTAFLQEITNQHIAFDERFLESYMPYIRRYMRGQPLSIEDDFPEPSIKLYNKAGFSIGDLLEATKPGKNQESVAVIPLHGMITKRGTWWNYGADEVAEMLNEAYKDEGVKAVVLDTFTPGGATTAAPTLSNALKKRNKPVIGAVNTLAMSLGYYSMVHTDAVMAVGAMTEVGSIGVMAEIVNYDEAYKKEGIKIHRIVPPESKWKNKAYNEAAEGNYELLIKEELSPWAKHFQDVVKANRPNLKLDTEGIIEGRTFYAGGGDYTAKEIGLIDDIMPMEDIIAYAFSRATLDTKLTHIFNS
jgi:protease-4